MSGHAVGGAGPLVVVVLGPTGVGKSALALELAERQQGEIVSADSRQVYRRLDIGTGKATAEERARVPHHMIDLIDPNEQYDVARYVEAAKEAMAKVLARGRLPLLVGGTGFYLRAVTGELRLPMVPGDPKLRALLAETARRSGAESLHRRLAKVDPESAARLHPNDTRRVIRALEIYELTGRPRSSFAEARGGEGEFRFLKIGLRLSREALYERINRRVEQMVLSGWVEETRRLLEEGYEPGCPGLKTLGYPEIIGYLYGKQGLGEAIERIQVETRRYAKRQMTWFAREAGVRWLDIEEGGVADKSLRLVAQALEGEGE